MAHPPHHSDMFHPAPPPPPPLHYAPPPHRQYHPSTPVSDAHASPHPNQHPAYQPRQFPTTPQTPNYASTSRSTDYPPTPQTPQHPSTPHTQYHGTPQTPAHSNHTPHTREYYPSPPAYNNQPHAGPSRLHPPPTHPHQTYQQRYDNAVPTQPPFRSSPSHYSAHPHSAPPRTMQHWSEQPQHSSPTGDRSGAVGELDVCSQFLNLNSETNGAEDSVQVPSFVRSSVPTMKVAHWTPEEGRQAQEITVTLEVEDIPDPHDTYATRSAQRAFRGMFGKLPCSTRVSVSNTPGRSPTSRIVTLHILAPPLHMTGCTERSNQVPIYIQSLRAHDIEESLHVGDFTYIIPPSHARVQSMPPTALESQAPSFNQGAKRSGEPLEQDIARPWSASEAHHHHRIHSGGSGLEHSQVEYGSVAPSDTNVFQFNYPPQSDHGIHDANAAGWEHPSMAVPQSAPHPTKHVRTSHPQAPNARINATPAPSVMQPPAPMILQPPPFGQPSLIRSSQIAGGASWYERLRAEIVFQSDLLSMTRAWTPAEWNAKRRLVKVWRRQVDSQIFMAFRAITPEEYSEGESAVVVSCIFREDKNTCYITSVDIIYLLEAVIGQRFSIEEKNRIRRNLEGYRPQTVSKNKPGSEDFFRTVMAFPDPKPRNIEKDLKVFQWDCLPQAVKKIISKYTAQYHPSGEPLVPQGVTDAHHEIRPPHPDFQPAPPAPFHLAQQQVHPTQAAMQSHLHSTADNGGWSHQQAQADATHYDPALFGQAHQSNGYANGTSASRQTHLQIDTAAANAYAGPNGSMNGNAYYPASAATAAAYSPTPQMTHSSSSNLVPSEFVVSPVATGQPEHLPSGPASAPPTSVSHAHTLPRPNGGYLQQQQATAPPPYSDVQSTFWSGQGTGPVYSMTGSSGYDDGAMYANLLVKPVEENGATATGAGTGEVDTDVRNIYTANSA